MKKKLAGNKKPWIVGSKEQAGHAPAIALINPKFSHNVGGALRAASCFGMKQVWFTGDRVNLENRKRITREERMKGFQDVSLIHYDNFFDQFNNVTPVAIEVRPGSESLHTFEHPENALYVFGPEDGSIGSNYLRHCHRFVVIPTRHCVNLSSAVYIILYDRLIKRSSDIVTIDDMLAETRDDFLNHKETHDKTVKDLGLL